MLAMKKAAGSGSLKIYGIEVVGDGSFLRLPRSFLLFSTRTRNI